MDKLELKLTSDGSYTLFLPSYEETYHSVHGAIQEAMHVFIDAGLREHIAPKVSILEIGFGTGLNCLLTFMENEKLKKVIHYTGVEAYPVESDLIDQLNYSKLLNLNDQQKSAYDRMHDSNWDEQVNLREGFVLKKEKTMFELFELKTSYDIVYYDAFGPRVQPELWGEILMTKMYECLNSGGYLVTYCAKGSFKRALKKVGFEVERLPGPPGKREMTRAWKR